MADTSAGATPATVPAGARVVLLVSRGPEPGAARRLRARS